MGSFRFNPRGTRFRIYPQSRSVKGFETPIVVHVDSRPGTIGPGPADSTMYVVDATGIPPNRWKRSEEHTSELQSRPHLVCRLLLEKKKSTLSAVRSLSYTPQRPRAPT